MGFENDITREGLGKEIAQLNLDLKAGKNLVFDCKDPEIRESILEVMEDLSGFLAYLRFCQELELLRGVDFQRLMVLLSSPHCGRGAVAILIKLYSKSFNVDFEGTLLASDEVKLFLATGVATMDEVGKYSSALKEFAVKKETEARGLSAMSWDRFLSLTVSGTPFTLSMNDTVALLDYYFDDWGGSVEELTYDAHPLPSVSVECAERFLNGGQLSHDEVRLISVILPKVVKNRLVPKK